MEFSPFLLKIKYTYPFNQTLSLYVGDLPMLDIYQN